MSELIYQSIHSGTEIDEAVSSVGNIEALVTTNKSNLVAAINEVKEQNNDLAVNVKNFGVVGDGVTDDTQAIQNAFTSANNNRLIIPSNFNCLITDTITMPDNIIIDCQGQFTCTGDVDYWFYADNPTKIIFENIKITLTTDFASRTLLNRAIMCNTPIYFEVKIAEIVGSSTAIHSLFGEEFICGDIILKNVYGIDAQYGYGVNSSAKRTTIHNLIVINDDTSNGRHAVYINGEAWENVVIDNIYVKNWNKNPINISNTDINAKCNITIKVATFVNANIVPMDTTTGCIHGVAGNSNGVRIRVESLYVRNIAGSALATTGGCDGLYIGNLYAEELAVAYNVNTYLIYSRYGSNQQIGRVFCTGLNTNWLAGVYLRDTINSVVDDVNIEGVGAGQALRLNNAIVTVGNIKTENIDKIFSTGSTVTYKQLAQTFGYGGSIPTTGTWKLGDIVWETNPVLGSRLGWVCTAAGSPGTWETFGILGAVRMASQTDSVATDVAVLKSDFNALLAKLRNAKLMS